MTRRTATLTGFVAVLLWALLALFTVATDPVPPFQLTALTFGIGAGVGLAWGWGSGTLSQLSRVPARIYVFGTVGLFGYHALYFSALRLAPPAEAGLIAYLWPLLIVLFSGLLPGEVLRRGHIAGAILGFAGAALIIGAGRGTPGSGAFVGYGLALLCALFWSGYSVLSRRFGDVPTVSVTVFCAATAVLSGGVHLLAESWVTPTISGWLAIAGLGLGPVGVAFFVWDVGMKRGDIQVLGAASYAAPLLSTVALVVAGLSPATWTLAGATALIMAGAALAARASAARG
ncbi:EamA-like transporter family protein [Loktanella sp. DSM 29012]|uniref:aromatic amino acid exporter YddG n=1 Tax=Loktanella sp. DSM 29012 TaxID=1881056 RepID=UPI0008C43704|nr:EamA family transporter [Loktanella sp. DSM 29012]SEQ73064.1 EamA-like transporter family protein [Loktanella sp. DSM 29012]